MKKPFKLFVIHHSHTDIGYTERQEKITKFHVEFIKQAIEISERIASGEKPEWAGFCWTCESFWGVEQFLNKVDENWKKRFEEAIKRGHIEVAGNYLNMTEMVDEYVLKSNLQKSMDYCNAIGVELDTGMTADINGYSWGYPQALLDVGIKNFFSCVHTHHGMFPLRRKQTPFWWETKKGERLLVWSGDHYHTGNALGIQPRVIWSKNEDNQWCFHEEIEKELEQTNKKIREYMGLLEKQNYAYDFLPIMISGLPTDNAPPSPYIMLLINAWNKKYGDDIQIEMTSLHQFFEHLRKETIEIPVYRGDWPDWWADGVSSTPGQTKLFREAQRRLRVVRQLNETEKCIPEEKIKEIEYNLMMYAEHTWGYSSSIWEPWNTMVNTLGLRKDMYATKAHLDVSEALDSITEVKGEQSLSTGRALAYKVINPFKYAITDVAKIYIDFWEVPFLEEGFEVIRQSDGKSIPYQLEHVARGTEINIHVSMDANEEQEFYINYNKKDNPQDVYYPLLAADRVKDLVLFEDEKEEDKINIDQNGLETEIIRISWSEKEGINSWYNKKIGKEMLRGDRHYGAFSPIYEITPNEKNEHVGVHRNNMGRNRKGINAKRAEGRLVHVNILSNSSLFAKVELTYDLPGTTIFSLLLTAYKDIPRVDVEARMNKESVWEPENIYIALPFTTGEEEVLWAEKTGTIFRPRIDQLPGTGTDFYSLQEGMAYTAKDHGMIIATPDVPLIQMGTLAHKPIVLHEEDKAVGDGDHLYSWVMNNFWETNFKASLAGFYEFKYSICWGEAFKEPEEAIKQCNAINMGPICFRRKG